MDKLALSRSCAFAGSARLSPLWPNRTVKVKAPET
jgi:hypothetical protein